MMRDVDGLNRFYDPLIQLYEERREAARISDYQHRPDRYNPALFPTQAVKCTDTTPSAPSTLLQFGTQPSQIIGRKKQPEVPYMSYGMNYPVCVVFGTPFSSTLIKLHPTTKSSSIEIIERCQPFGWISVGSQFGNLLHAFKEPNPTMSRLPCLLIEHCSVACTTCKLVLPSAIVLQSDFAYFSAMLQVMSSAPTIRATTLLCPMGETIKQFLVDSIGILGIDLHAPSSCSMSLSIHWLNAALHVIDMLSRLARK
jgi:hypothetical protein